MQSPVQPFQTTRYTLSSPPTGEHFAFATSSRSGDHKFRFVWTLAPGKRGPGHHVHPEETESFEVISGTLRIWVGGVPRDLKTGDRFAVPPGTAHSFLNPEKIPCVANVTLDGPRLEDTFVPAAVYSFERPGLLGILRFMVTTPVHRGSMSTSAVANGIGYFLIGVLKLFGMKPFDPVFGWDQPEFQAEKKANAA